MKGAFKLGTIAGIGVFVHWTFSLLIAYIIFSNYRAGESTVQIFWSVVFVLSIFGTVFLHELGHALAAKRFHIKTKDITLLPIGGLARLDHIPEKPAEELIVAVAGPAVNLGLAAITALVISFPSQESLTLQMTSGVTPQNFLLNFFVVNVWLALFNLIPAFPMDGGRVLRAILSMRMDRKDATNIAAKVGQLLAMGFVFLGFYANPFLIFIGLFIFLGAQAEASTAQTRFMLAGSTVNDVVMHHYETIDASETVSTAVHMLLNGQAKTFLVTQDGNPVGTLSRDEIILALSQSGGDSPVHSIMNKDLLFLQADTPLENAYLQMQQHRSSLMPVMADHKLLGTVDKENILEFLMVKHATEKNR